MESQNADLERFCDVSDQSAKRRRFGHIATPLGGDLGLGNGCTERSSRHPGVPDTIIGYVWWGMGAQNVDLGRFCDVSQHLVTFGSDPWKSKISSFWSHWHPAGRRSRLGKCLYRAVQEAPRGPRYHHRSWLVGNGSSKRRFRQVLRRFIAFGDIWDRSVKSQNFDFLVT